MRRLLTAIVILILFLCVAYHLFAHEAPQRGVLMDVCLDSAYEDTGAQNAVAAIYLDYRVFDTLLESLLLLISIVAVIHFTAREEPHDP